MQVLGLLRPLILARLLAPEDFGIVGIAVMTRLIIERIGISGGLYDALIRRDDLTKEHYAAAWTFEVGRAAIFGGIIAISAPFIADFFRSPDATPIIRIAGLELALASLSSMGMILARKELRFNKDFYYRLVPSVIGTAITIWLAFELRNVWALALGQLSITVIRVSISYWLAPMFLRPTWNFSKLKDLAGFAIWTSISNLLSVVASQVDRFFVGRMLGTASLGGYVIAGRITNLVSFELSNGVSRVGFPTFSKLQARPDALNKAFTQLIATSVFILGPLALYLVVWAPELVEVVLGPKWLDSIPAVRILAGAAVLLALARIYITVLRSLGRAAIGAGADTIKLVAMIAVAYPLISEFGISGAGLTMVVGSAFALMFVLWRSKGILRLSLYDLVKILLIAGLLSGGLLAAPALRDVGDLNMTLVFVIGTMSFSAGYLLFSAIMFRFFHFGPLQLVADIRARRTKPEAA